MRWVLTLLVLLVACPGTPPGNFVRDVASGEIVKCGAALCVAAAARQGAAVAPDAAMVSSTAPAPPRVDAPIAIVDCEPRLLPASPGVCAALGARAPPVRG